jgi:hypothetical protein
MAALHRGARQHGDGGVAAPARGGHADEPVRGEHPRPVRERPLLPRGLQHRQPAGPRTHPGGALRGGRMGSAAGGHETDRRLAAGARDQHSGRAPELCDPARRPEAGSPAVLFLPRTLVAGLPRPRPLHDPAFPRAVAGAAGQPGAGVGADDDGVDVPGQRAEIEGARRRLLQPADETRGGAGRVRPRLRGRHRSERRNRGGGRGSGWAGRRPPRSKWGSAIIRW